MAEEEFMPTAPQPPIEPKPALTFRARLLFVLVAVIGLGSLVWGGWRMGQNMKAPFLPKGNANTGAEISQLIILQGKDTDEDGLSDYDETYVYKTSPYLKDTDSDGFDDKTEISTGNDPNCPAGANCGLPDVNTNASTTGPAMPDTSGLNQILSGSLTADQIRALMIESGVAKEELDKIDDQTLIALYQQALAEQASSQNANTNTNSDNLTDLKNLSASEVRDLLVKQGANKAELDKIDDATLLKNWQDILAEEESNTNQ
ncbi:MAG: hypothetical protein V1684_00345 [bacterium]